MVIDKTYSRTTRSSFNVKYSSDLTPYRTLWFSAGVCDLSNEFCFLMKLKFKVCSARKCIRHPFSLAMGLDGTLTNNIELVCDSFDMACQSAIYIAREWLSYAYHLFGEKLGQRTLFCFLNCSLFCE